MDEDIKQWACDLAMNGRIHTSDETRAHLCAEFSPYSVEVQQVPFAKKWRWEVCGSYDNGQRRHPIAISRIFPGHQTTFMTREAAEVQCGHFERWLHTLQGK